MLNNPYGKNGIELDLRKELKELLYGSIGEIPKGKVGLLRRMRRDGQDRPIRCPCRDKITDEPSRDFYCKTCLGEGYLWDEHKIIYYKNNVSFRQIEDKTEAFQRNMFYFEFPEDVSPVDFVVEVQLDKEGRPIQPVKRIRMYDIMGAVKMRADRGRVELWQIRAKIRRNWSVWYGVQQKP